VEDLAWNATLPGPEWSQVSHCRTTSELIWWEFRDHTHWPPALDHCTRSFPDFTSNCPIRHQDGSPLYTACMRVRSFFASTLNKHLLALPTSTAASANGNQLFVVSCRTCVTKYHSPVTWTKNRGKFNGIIWVYDTRGLQNFITQDEHVMQ
jgi:hypothetical protein